METLVTKFIPFPPDEDEYELLSVSAETFEQISYDSWQYSQQENYLNFNEVDSKHSIWAHKLDFLDCWIFHTTIYANTLGKTSIRSLDAALRCSRQEQSPLLEIYYEYIDLP
ncbi:unnamed protein product [Rhizophagus irregularis]|nr:unnamed protein product [Rhizophagus irregularis]CAB5197476.1 unnamed protein product [Rhizophagus irregularis]